MAAPLELPEGGAEVWDRRLGVRLRPYQADALEVFRARRAEGRRRFHFVAPPGSGKTVLGLALLLEAGAKGVVFSPNAAIQVQWADRFDEITAAVGPGEAAAFSPGPEGRTSFLSLTYQSVSTRRTSGEGPHPNAVALLERLRAEGYRSFVRDECHHLTGYWGGSSGSPWRGWRARSSTRSPCPAW